ncbi:MAG: STAS domain-containing protein [Agarilytica sp.]
MTPGTIKIAEHEGVFVIKMEGDVRLTLCLSFDEFIEDMLNKPNYTSVVFDLTQAQAIDSTTLGLMAKVSIKAGHHGHESPLVVSSNPSITRILVSMGFDDIFRLVDKSEFDGGQSSDDEVIVIVEKNGNETEVQKKVIEAHHVLMDLNDDNRACFTELVETLEAQK